MKRYRLSNTSTNFRKFLDTYFALHYAGGKQKLSIDGKCLYVWMYCDQDLLELGMKWEAAKGTLQYA